jgi:hypothetical protein
MHCSRELLGTFNTAKRSLTVALQLQVSVPVCSRWHAEDRHAAHACADRAGSEGARDALARREQSLNATRLHHGWYAGVAVVRE